MIRSRQPQVLTNRNVTYSRRRPGLASSGHAQPDGPEVRGVPRSSRARGVPFSAPLAALARNHLVRYAGHSLRAGLVTAIAGDAPERAIMR
jgi:hypothetical protein